MTIYVTRNEQTLLNILFPQTQWERVLSTRIRYMHPRLKSEHEQGHFSRRISAFYYPASGGRGEGNKRARIKRKGSWLSIRPEDLHVFGRSSFSCRRAGCAYEAHLCIFMRYQWPSNELQAGASNHVQRIRGVILNARLLQDLCSRESKHLSNIVLCHFLFPWKTIIISYLKILSSDKRRNLFALLSRVMIHQNTRLFILIFMSCKYRIYGEYLTMTVLSNLYLSSSNSISFL